MPSILPPSFLLPYQINQSEYKVDERLCSFSHVFCIAIGLTHSILNLFLHPQPIDLTTTVTSFLSCLFYIITLIPVLRMYYNLHSSLLCPKGLEWKSRSRNEEGKY